jgi:hypothetical protein
MGGLVVPIPPLAELGRLAQVFAAAKMYSGADAASANLAGKYRSGLNEALKSYQTQREGTLQETPPLPEEVGGGPGEPTGTPPDPRGAVTNALMSGYGPLHELALHDYANQQEREKQTRGFEYAGALHREPSGASLVSAATAAQAPEKVALDKFLKEHPNATGEELQAFRLLGRGPRSPQSLAVLKFMSENPDATSDDISRFLATMHAQGASQVYWDVGKGGQTTASFNKVALHLNTAERAMNALNNNDLPAFNRASNALATATGQPAPGNFDAVKQILGNEIVKSIVGAGGGVEDRSKAQEILANWKSPAQSAGVFSQLRELIGGQLEAQRHQYEASLGKKDYEDKYLLPEAKTLLRKPAAPSGTPGGWSVVK